YIVFDQSIAQQFEAWPYFVSTAPGVAYAYLSDYRRNRRDIYHQADTPAALADSMHVPAAALTEMLERYNSETGERGARPALSAGTTYAPAPVQRYVMFT